MNYKAFEESELENFMDKFYDYENTKLLLSPLNNKTYLIVREKTKKGIEEGIEQFLESQPDLPTLYMSDLTKFCFDESIKTKIIENLNLLPFNPEDKDVYAEDVCQTYRMFVYNESLDKFIKLKAEETSLSGKVEMVS